MKAVLNLLPFLLAMRAAALSAPQEKTPMLPERETLHAIAIRVLNGASVPPEGRIPGDRVNVTGYALRLPGATLEHYPAFWVRDAAMMLGADFVPAKEVEGWIRLIASVQAGPEGIRFPHGLYVPPYSIPDHITLKGAACWYPGAYEEQGNGTFGFLPPTDDAFYFLQMVHAHFRLTGNAELLKAAMKTPWGDHPLMEIAEKAFDSVAADGKTGLVICAEEKGQTRVDWGFCDTVRKTGLSLMPSLLRWRATRDLADLFRADRQAQKAQKYLREAARIQKAILIAFYQRLEDENGRETGILLSATGKGRQEDVWASAYAIWLGILPKEKEQAIARRLRALYRAGGTVVEGQIRHLPSGVYWEDCVAGRDQYQNGGFWATPTGWYVAALLKLDDGTDGRKLFAEYMAHLAAQEKQGAPFEWINPSTNARANPRYCSSVGLVYVALSRR